MKRESAEFGPTKIIMAVGVVVIFVAGAAACNKQESGQSAKEHETDSAQPSTPQLTPVQKVVKELERLCTTAFAGECEATVDAAMADHDLADITKELSPLCKAEKAGWACLCVAHLKHKVGDDAGAREYVLNSCQNRYLPGCGAAGDIALELNVMKGVDKMFAERDLVRFYAGVLLAVESDQAKALDLFSAFCDEDVMEMCEVGGVYADAMGVNDLAEGLAHRACQAKRATACRSLGGWHVRRKETDKAIQAYKSGCTEGDYLTCVLLGDLLRDQGDKDESSRLFKKACEAGESMGCIGLGRNYGEAGQPLMALEYYAKACQLGEPKGCYVHGIASLEQGFDDTALESLQKACSGGMEDSCPHAEKLREQHEMGDALEKHFNSRIREYIDGAPFFPKNCRVRVALEKILSDTPDLLRSGNQHEVKGLLNELRIALAEPEGRQYATHVSFLSRADDVLFGPALTTYVSGLERILEVMSKRRVKPKVRTHLLEELTGIVLWKELKNWEREVISRYGTLWTVQAMLAEELRDTYRLKLPGETREAQLTLANSLAGLALEGVSNKDMDSARDSLVYFWRDISQYERKRP